MAVAFLSVTKWPWLSSPEVKSWPVATRNDSICEESLMAVALSSISCRLRIFPLPPRNFPQRGHPTGSNTRFIVRNIHCFWTWKEGVALTNDVEAMRKAMKVLLPVDGSEYSYAAV